MSWIVQPYGNEVHVVPDTEEGHVLSADCWCGPEHDPVDLELWRHNDELDRTGLGKS